MRFFRSQTRSYEQADDLLQETWLRIHRVRHTYRPGEPVLPWVYAIARRVGVDGYRRTRRVSAHETPMEVLPERPEYRPPPASLPDFETLVAGLPEAQREVITLLKVGGLSLEEVACATSSSVGAVKQKAHRAYERLRAILAARLASRPDRGSCRRKSMTRRDLDRILSESAQAVPPRDGSGIDPAVLQDLEKSVAANLLPVRPLPPRSFFFTAFAGSFVLIVAISVCFMKALAIPLMTPLQLTLILSTLGIGAALLAISLVDQMAPGSRQRLRPEFLLPGVVALLLAVVALLFPFGSEPDFVAHGWTCFRAGFPLALLTAIPIWFLLRKGAVLLPRITGATAGLMAGRQEPAFSKFIASTFPRPTSWSGISASH